MTPHAANSSPGSKPRLGLLFAVTDAVTADAFLRPHLEKAKQQGHGVTLVADKSPLLQAVAMETGVTARTLRMSRTPDPLRDLRAILSAVRVVRSVRPAASHVGTPKAGLIVGLASAICRVPTRMYTLHGLRFETAVGWRRWLLISLEKASCAAATTVVAVSESVANEAITLGLAPARKVQVLGSGSISGVDIARFDRDGCDAESLRSRYGLHLSGPVVLFVGRLSEDKGIRELAAAWRAVSTERDDCHLLIVGAPDPAQPPPPETIEDLRRQPSVVLAGYLSDPADAYSVADLLVLPTYREGFGTVILEAAAAGVPAIASNVTGCRDAVVDGETGLLVESRNAQALANAILTLVKDPGLRGDLGNRARARVARSYRQEDVVGRYLVELTS